MRILRGRGSRAAAGGEHTQARRDGDGIIGCSWTGSRRGFPLRSRGRRASRGISRTWRWRPRWRPRSRAAGPGSAPRCCRGRCRPADVRGAAPGVAWARSFAVTSRRWWASSSASTQRVFTSRATSARRAWRSARAASARSAASRWRAVKIPPLKIGMETLWPAAPLLSWASVGVVPGDDAGPPEQGERGVVQRLLRRREVGGCRFPARRARTYESVALQPGPPAPQRP